MLVKALYLLSLSTGQNYPPVAEACIVFFTVQGNEYIYISRQEIPIHVAIHKASQAVKARPHVIAILVNKISAGID